MNKIFCDFCGMELAFAIPKVAITLRKTTFKEGNNIQTMELYTVMGVGDHISVTNLELCRQCCIEWYDDIARRIKR
jgi:hypothetical protein